jgi:DNA-binding transcriptional LysR family regulator
VAQVIGQHHFVAFLPPGSAVPTAAITWSDLARFPLIGVEKSDTRWRAADASFLNEGAMPDVVVEVTQRDLMLPLVAAGIGATVGYEYLRDDAERLGIVTVPFVPEVSRAVELVRRRQALDPHVEACWSLITDADRSPSPI